MNYLSNKFRTKNPRQSSGSRKRGIASVEMAFVLPIMFLITLGTLETCEGIFLTQKITIAAAQGAIAAVHSDGSFASVEDAVGSYLDARGVLYDNISTVVSTTPNPEQAEILDPMRVTVTISRADNYRMPTSFYRLWSDDELSAEVVMFKEYVFVTPLAPPTTPPTTP